MRADFYYPLVKHQTEIILFAVSFIVHLAASIFLYSKFGDQLLFFENEDVRSYVNLAQSVARGEGFAYQGFPSATRTPLYPLLLSAINFFNLPFVWSVLLMQNLIASLAGVLLYRLGRTFFSPRVGKIAGAVYVLEPYMLMTANLATTETFFNLLLIAFVYTFARWYAAPLASKKDLVWSALFLGLATLTRPILLYFPVLVFLLCLALVVFFKKDLKLTFISFGIFLTVFITVLAPWSIRQFIQFRSPRLTNIDAYMLYFKVAPLVVARQEGITYDKATQLLAKRLAKSVSDFSLTDMNHTFKYYAYMVREAKRLIKADPAPVARQYLASLVPALTGTGYEYMLENVLGLERVGSRVSYSGLLLQQGWAALWRQFKQVDVFQISLLFGLLLWGVSYLLILYGLLQKAAWKRYTPLFLILLSVIGYFVLFSLGPASHARYRMPTFPFLFLLIAFSLDFFSRKRIITLN